MSERGLARALSLLARALSLIVDTRVDLQWIVCACEYTYIDITHSHTIHTLHTITKNCSHTHYTHTLYIYLYIIHTHTPTSTSTTTTHTLNTDH